MADTALICRVPEAERFIARYRERFDPSARRNVPAHVTILYPFMPPARSTPRCWRNWRTSRAPSRAFSYRLAELRRFPVALYLAPQPDTSFAALTDAVHRAFPGLPALRREICDAWCRT